MELADTTLEATRLLRAEDWPLFDRLGPVVQGQVLQRLGWIARHRRAPHRHKGRVVTAASAALDVAESSFRRYLTRFDKEGLAGITDTRRAKSGGGRKSALPARFVSFVHGKYDAHQREDDRMEVWRSTCDQWRQWRATGDPEYRLPGYDRAPDPHPATGLPYGWSYDTFRRISTGEYERAAAKRGRKAASDLLPSVLTTRAGSAVLSRVLFDDQDLDNMLADGTLAIAGITEAQRPVSFNSLDFYTAAHLDAHLRAVAKDPASGKNRTLTGREFAWFVIKHLQDKGWRTDSLGTELIFEHGTANTWANKALTSFSGHASFEDALYALSGGRCRVNRSGKFDGAIFSEMCFKPQSTGNFKFKTWIESAFRLLRTYMQALPGPTGSNQRLNGKDELYGIKLEEKRLLTAISEVVDPHTRQLLAASLEHELLDLPTFHQLIAAVYHAVNARTQHSLEGWDRCGFTVNLWRPSPQSETWFDQSELPEDEEERKFLLRRINANRDLLTKVDRLSPGSAFALEMKRDAAHLHRLPDSRVGLLLPIEWAIDRKVGKRLDFTLPNPLWPDTAEQYVAAWEEEGRRVELSRGTPILVHHNPFHDGRAHLYDTGGKYITTLHPTVKAEPFNPEKTLIQLQRRAQIQSGHDAHLRARMAGIGSERQRRAEANRQALALTREDRRRDRLEKEAREATEQAPFTPPETTPDPPRPDASPTDYRDLL